MVSYSENMVGRKFAVGKIVEKPVVMVCMVAGGRKRGYGGEECTASGNGYGAINTMRPFF